VVDSDPTGFRRCVGIPKVGYACRMRNRSRLRVLGLTTALASAGAIGTPGWAGPDEGPKAPASAPAPKPTSPSTAPAGSPSATAPVDPTAAALAFADAVDGALAKSVASVRESSVTVWNLKRVAPAPAAPTPPTTPTTPANPPPATGDKGDKGKAKPVDPDDDGAAYERQSGGSGVLVSWKGKGPYVITNEHVIKGGDRLQIATFDGNLYVVKLLDHVAAYDIALLDFVKGKPKSFKPAKFGKSEDLHEGQWVIATGNPFFLAGDGRCVATLGVISGLERTLKGDFTYANAIQHDTEVNPGNSGGPLWNLTGDLIGINGMISSRGGDSSITPSNTGASYSIPIHLILKYFDDLLSDKVSAAAGYLGIDLEDARDAVGKPIGARILAVRADSPAHPKKPDPKVSAPEKGDIVTLVSFGSTISSKPYDVFAVTDVVNALALYPAGTKVKMSFLRSGKKLTWAGELSNGVAK